MLDAWPSAMTGAKILWAPSPEWSERTQLARYTRWLRTERGLRFDDYDSLWRWSTENIDAFWGVDLGLL